MRIFNQIEPWPSKVNFIDDDCVILGYDMSQCCCEHADWLICSDITHTESSRIQIPESKNILDLDDFYFKKQKPVQIEDQDLDEGSCLAFEITHRRTDESLFIVIYNIQNGYYSHGYDFRYEGESGSI